MPSVELRESVPVAAAPETVWAVATDWPRQREWMLGTEVRVLSGGGGLGTQLLAFTGLGGVGFVDTMEITEFQPPAPSASGTPGSWCPARAVSTSSGSATRPRSSSGGSGSGCRAAGPRCGRLSARR